MRQLMRTGSAVLAIASASLALAGASGASNSASYSDAVGDAVYNGGYAPDVTSVTVASTDDGGVGIRVAMNEPGGTFYIGDTLAVVVDTDLNASTGDRDPARAAYAGSEIEIFATAARDSSGQGVVTYQYCVFGGGAFGCNDLGSDDVKHERTGTDSHQVTFLFTQGDWLVVGMRVIAFYTDPKNPSSSWIDRAPNSGLFQYDAKADPDSDQVPGTSDKCPRYPGGRLDARGGEPDGCAPFLAVPKFAFAAVPTGSGLLIRSFRMTNAGPASVTARLAGVTSHRRGSGPLSGVAGRVLSAGSLATLIYTSRDYFGSYKVVRVTRSGFQTVRTGCTPPGRAVLLACKKVRG
jgi:hypothetical protein